MHFVARSQNYRLMKNTNISFLILIQLTISMQGACFGKMIDDQQNSPQDLFQLGVNRFYTNPDSTAMIAAQLYNQGFSEKDTLKIIKGKMLSGFIYVNNLYRLDTAEMILNETIDLIESTTKNKSDLALSWYYLGNVHLRQSKGDIGMGDATVLLDLAEETNDELMRIKGLFLKGEIEYTLFNDVIKALGYYLEADKLRRKSEIEGIKVFSLVEKLGDIYNSLGQYDKAIEYGLELLNMNGLPKTWLGSVYFELGDAYFKKGELEEALYYLENSVKHPHKKRLIISYYDRARYRIAEINSKMANYEKSQSIIKELIKQEAFEFYDFYSIIALNQFGINSYDSAIYYALKSLNNKNSDLAKRSDMAGILHKCYEKLGQVDSTKYYFSVHHDLITELNSKKRNENMSALYAQLETHEKQIKIDTLVHQNEVANSKAGKISDLLWFSIIISSAIVLYLIMIFTQRRRILIKQKEQLLSDINQKQKDLSQQSVRIIQKSNSLSELEENLKMMKKKVVNGHTHEVQQMLNTIRLSKVIDKEWDKYDEHFGSSNQSFMKNLGLEFPALTVNDKRLASLVKDGYTNREISELMNIEIKSVRMAKYRLKKKLELAEEVKLQVYLLELDQVESHSY